MIRENSIISGLQDVDSYLLLQRYSTLMIVLACMFFVAVAWAEDEDGGEYTLDLSNSYDYKRISGEIGRLAPHGNSLMGDMIDKHTGSLVFTHTDVSIPGNSGLEVALHRKITQGPQSYTAYQQAFGDWVLDIPIISNLHAGDDPTINGGCLVQPGGLNQEVDTSAGFQTAAIPVKAASHNEDAAINVPGKGLSGFKAPFGTPNDPKSNWINGGQETDFANRCATVVIAPDGTKYKFGLHAFRYGKTLNMPTTYQFDRDDTRPGDIYVPGEFGSVTEHVELYLPRQNTVLLVTEVVDVHGNYVRYEYTNDAQAQLTRIYSDDAREITLHYKNEALFPSRNSTRVSHIVAHDPSDAANNRTWQYTYETDGGSALQKVTLPDGRFWQLGAANSGLSAMRYEKHQYYLCLPYDFTFSIKHPDGASGTFRLVETRHIKSAINNGDPFNDEIHYINPQVIPVAIDNSVCSIGKVKPSSTTGRERLFEKPQGWPIYHSMSVVEKTISGANIPTATWGFDYRNYDGTASSGGLDLSQTWTTITEPDGTKRKYIYQTRGIEHGLLKNIEVSDNSVVLETFEYNYDLRLLTSINLGQFACLGGGAGEHGDSTGACFNFMKRPETLVVHKRYSNANPAQFDEYTTEKKYAPVSAGAGTFTDYGYPNKVMTYSSLQSEQRIIDVTYEHKVGANIIGLIKQVDRNGKEFARYEYFTDGLRQHIYQFGTKRRTFTYHGNGTTASITNALSQTATLGNYYRGQPRTITRRDGTIFTRTVNANGWVTSETNPNSYTINYDYNAAGWLTLVDRPTPWFDTQLVYHNVGTSNFYRTITQAQNKTTEWYDSMFRPRLVKQQDTQSGWLSYVNYGYDTQGREIFSSYPSTSTLESEGITTSYDGLGRVTNMTQFPNITTDYQYVVNNTTRVTDADGYITTTTKSGFRSPSDGALLTIASPENSTTTMSYDIWGNIETLTQSGNQDGSNVSNTHQYYYDTKLRVCRRHIPELGSQLIQYNNENQIAAYAQGQAATTVTSSALGAACLIPTTDKVQLTYDDVGQLEDTLYSGATTNILREYDINGNLEKLTRGNIVWEYDYYPNDMLQEERLVIDGLQFDINYERDGYGNIKSLTYPSGDKVVLTPDAFGRPTALFSSNTDYVNTYALNIEYHLNQSLKSFSYGNGVEFNQTLNARMLPHTRSVWKDNGGSTLDILDYTYLYDGRANPTSIIDGVVTAHSVDNTFDGLSRLKTADSAFGDITFTYDAIGNLRSRDITDGNTLGGSQHNTTINYSSNNRVANALTSSGTRSYGYDNRGNVDNNGTNSFVYDLANQPISMDGNANAFLYDGNLKRVKKTTGTDVVYFVYSSGAGLISQYNKTKGLHTDYVRLANQTIARVESAGSAADNQTTPFNNSLSSIPDTGLTGRDYYLPFGKSISVNTSGDNGVGFTGHIKDDSGLTYMQARYYDPVIGRFYSNDPVGFDNVHNFNRYTYANNNPYKYVDPDGKYSTKAHTRIINAALAGNPAAAIVAQGSADFDKTTQSTDLSHYHSLRQSGESATSMINKRADFVSSMKTAIQSIPDRQQGGENSAVAHKLFGALIHPVMDKYSPAHNDNQGNPLEWKPFDLSNVLETLNHSPVDWLGGEGTDNLTPDDMKGMVNEIRNLYDEVFKEE